jgi:pyridoxal phosphate enzyme (YggS family)
VIDLAANLNRVQQRIMTAANHGHREEDPIQLLAVSKTRPASIIREAAGLGLRAFGESYLQEALAKIPELKDLDICWHFIGRVQSNKCRPIAENFAWVHGVDSLKQAQRLSTYRPEGLPPLNLCLQVNTSGEMSKGGLPPEKVRTIAAEVNALPRLKLRGLMTLPAPCQDPIEQREPFRQLAQLLGNLQQNLPDLDCLSMGMSNDLEAAIAEGATIVRIGTALFGPREKPQTTP